MRIENRCISNKNTSSAFSSLHSQRLELTLVMNEWGPFDLRSWVPMNDDSPCCLCVEIIGLSYTSGNGGQASSEVVSLCSVEAATQNTVASSVNRKRGFATTKRRRSTTDTCCAEKKFWGRSGCTYQRLRYSKGKQGRGFKRSERSIGTPTIFVGHPRQEMSTCSNLST